MHDVTLHLGDCIEVMRDIPDASVDCVLTDPPYGLSFMGKEWDHGVPGVAFWIEALRLLKPGGHLLSFGGTRTYHRMACAIEDAGFEIRDQIQWIYGQGFPKSLDVSKAIDKMHGAEREAIGRYELPDVADGYRKKGWECTNTTDAGIFGLTGQMAITTPTTESAKQWQGFGTALKPANEPICLARKPLEKGLTVAQNVLKWGTGAMNIDGCRVGTSSDLNPNDYDDSRRSSPKFSGILNGGKKGEFRSRTGIVPNGRFPANVIHDGSDEVVGLFPQTTSGKPCGIRNATGYKVSIEHGTSLTGFGDSGSAARFFYCAKASKSDRGQNSHPTVKPTDLMRYLCRLATPPNGTILDPFMGSGSTGKGALLEGFKFIGIERDENYFAIAEKRIAEVAEKEPLFMAA